MTTMSKKVRCNGCMWEGNEDELVLKESSACPSKFSEMTEYCPSCGNPSCLMDLEPRSRFIKKKLCQKKQYRYTCRPI